MPIRLAIVCHGAMMRMPMPTPMPTPTTPDPQLSLRDDTELRAAHSRYGRELAVTVSDDAYGETPVWAMTDDAYGAVMGLVVAPTHEAAYRAAMEMLSPVSLDDMHEAHDMTREAWDAYLASATDDHPDLACGYGWGAQGDVYYTDYLQVWPIALSAIRSGGIAVTIRHYDAA